MHDLRQQNNCEFFWQHSISYEIVSNKTLKYEMQDIISSHCFITGCQ
jgi:hypothetical protein